MARLDDLADRATVFVEFSLVVAGVLIALAAPPIAPPEKRETDRRTQASKRVSRRVAVYVFAAWLIIQVGETVFPVFDIPDAFLRGLILLLILAFVPVLMFASAFEWTPDGIRRETDVDVPERVKRQMVHRLNQATLIAAVLAIGLMIADRMLPEPATPANASSTDTRGETAPDDRRWNDWRPPSWPATRAAPRAISPIIADIYRRLGESRAANALLSQDLASRDPDLIPLLPYLHDLMAGDLAPGSADVQRLIALARELGLDAHELARPGITYGLRVPREIATALGHADTVA